MIWRCATYEFDTRMPIVMGILNVTPDSFSDGGQHDGFDAALAHAERMAEEGARIIDVGGESTRPGAAPVSVDEELARVLPVVRALAQRDVCVSIDTRHAEVARACLEAGAAIVNDVSGFRAEADLMVWWLDDDPEVLQDAYHRLRASALGKFLDPVWSCMGLHTPAEFNKRHIPACFGGVAPRDWAMVYPFVRSYDWYLKAPEERARIMAEHGRNGFAQYPDVKGSTLSAFGFSDYEWVLAFEADTLDRLEGVMHAQRYTEARLYVREDTPFFTGPRVSLGEWAERQPRA